MIRPILTAVPDALADLPRWVLWRTEIRNGKPTKVPKTARSTNASSQSPKTWAPFDTIATELQSHPDTYDGCGIALGDLPDSEHHLCGVDLDSCLDDNGTVADWAKPFVAALPTYGETSPSGTGLKFFFFCRAEDARNARAAFGFEPNAWGRKRSMGLNGAEHGPAVEIYIGPGRYFTVTGAQWPGTSDEVALLDHAALLRIAELVPKAAASAHSKVGLDNSRSAVAFRKGAAMRRAGLPYEDMVEALRVDPETAAWCREKGEANNGRELRRIWDRAAQDDDDLPTIRVVAGKRHEAADAGLAALASAAVPFYVRDRWLVRVCRTKAKAADGTPVTIPAVVPVTPPILGRALGLSARWEISTRKGEPIRIDPRGDIVEQIAGMIDEWPFPPLCGVIGTPTMRPDGTLLLREGYDPGTGYVLFNPPPMPAIPESPTKQDALDALAVLNGLLVDFPFANEASRSVALSMLLTPVLRGALSHAVPMHTVTAPEAGTGKSYLQDIASAIAVGDRCAVLTVANSEETEKRLIAAALAQNLIIALDNISELLMGDFLCQVTERPVLQIRPLGTSSLTRINNTFTVFANGNNLQLGADVVRRSIQCALDAELENPETREFSSDPVATVLANRGKYVAACLTIARAFIAAGTPNRAGRHASYEGWSDTVRSALIWLNWPDPVDTIANVQADDPIRQQRAAVFGAWGQELICDIGYQTSELIKLAEQYDGLDRARPALWNAFFAVAAPRTGFQQIDPKQLGKWLSRNINTIAEGHRLTVDRTDKARPRWKLTPTKDVGSEGSAG